LFGLSNGSGLAEVLRDEADLAEAIQPTPVDGLRILGAGNCCALAIQSLSQTRLAELFTWMREHFEFVIIDSSPVLPVADALLLARHTDGVLLSMLQDVSRMPMHEETHRRLRSLGIRILGTVVNGTSQDLYGYGARYLVPQKA
jgi:Mrp family chromosome partitioning ATPase